MSEEEKKALAYLKFYLSDIESEYFDKDFVISKKDLKIVLNLIEKQQKEIIDLKQINEEHRKLNGKLREENTKLKKKIENILDYIED